MRNNSNGMACKRPHATRKRWHLPLFLDLFEYICERRQWMPVAYTNVLKNYYVFLRRVCFFAVHFIFTWMRLVTDSMNSQSFLFVLSPSFPLILSRCKCVCVCLDECLCDVRLYSIVDWQFRWSLSTEFYNDFETSCVGNGFLVQRCDAFFI